MPLPVPEGFPEVKTTTQNGNEGCDQRTLFCFTHEASDASQNPMPSITVKALLRTSDSENPNPETESGRSRS